MLAQSCVAGEGSLRVPQDEHHALDEGSFEVVQGAAGEERHRPPAPSDSMRDTGIACTRCVSPGSPVRRDAPQCSTSPADATRRSRHLRHSGRVRKLPQVAIEPVTCMRDPLVGAGWERPQAKRRRLHSLPRFTLSHRK